MKEKMKRDREMKEKMKEMMIFPKNFENPQIRQTN